jgi:sulfur relay (sulfurtransferase) complex TusBCD TusD component (DsrE family)
VLVLLTSGTAPHEIEGSYNALPLAEALSLRGEDVEFLIGDAAHTARAGQDPHGARSSLEHMIAPRLAAGVESARCDTFCTPRGLPEADHVADVRVATICGLAAAVARCDTVVSS